LAELASSLADTGAEINRIEADASDPEDFGAQMTALYRRDGAPGVVIYNAVMGAPDKLLSSTVAHLHEAYPALFVKKPISVPARFDRTANTPIGGVRARGGETVEAERLRKRADETAAKTAPPWRARRPAMVMSEPGQPGQAPSARAM
jgi:hypothetical protein